MTTVAENYSEDQLAILSKPIKYGVRFDLTLSRNRTFRGVSHLHTDNYSSPAVDTSDIT